MFNIAAVWPMARADGQNFWKQLVRNPLIVATVYKLYKDRALLSADDVGMWAVGFVAAFVSAFLCVRWLLRYISSHDFVPFAWYRIAFGIVVLATWHFGLVEWTAH